MPGRESTAILRKLVGKTKKNTNRIHKERKEKKAKILKKRIEAESREVPDLFGSLTNGGQRPKRVVNSTDVWNWFREAIDEAYNGKLDVPYDSWEAPERVCAKKLLELYGANRVKGAVWWFCNNWEAMREQNKRLYGIPDICFLYKGHKSLFADAQMGRVPGEVKTKSRDRRHAGEWREGKRKIGLGW